jgi:hypothetical protein
MATTPEGKIKKKVVEVFKKYKVWYYMPANNGFGKSGIPDFVGINKGQFIGVECKADRTKKPTVLQSKQGEAIQQAGGIWMVVCDEETLAILENTLAK